MTDYRQERCHPSKWGKMTGAKMLPGACAHPAHNHRRITGRALRRGLSVLLLAMAFIAPAYSEERYSLDPKVASIAFSTSQLGLFSSHGQFRRFDASLVFDARYPQRTRISVTIDSASVDMPWREGAALLRSAEFFDVQHYPLIHFTSTSVEALSYGQYVIRGEVELRGRAQPLVLHAALIHSLPDPARGGTIADFEARGTLRRSAFGMTADEAFISDKVRIIIDARIWLPHAG